MINMKILKDRRKRIIIISLVCLVVLSIVGTLVHNRNTKSNSVIQRPEETYSEDYGGIKSQKMNDDGSSKVFDIADGDYTPMELGSDGILDIANSVNTYVLSGNCSKLSKEYTELHDVSCPVSTLPSGSKPNYGFQAKDAKTGNYRINGSYTGDKAGGFVIILNSSKELISYSYIRYIPAI